MSALIRSGLRSKRAATRSSMVSTTLTSIEMRVGVASTSTITPSKRSTRQRRRARSGLAPGTFDDGELMLRLVFNRSVAFPADLAGSAGCAGVNATSTAVLDLQKNGSAIGTITFTNAGASATFALSGGASFVAGDRLELINANPADATLADLSLALKGIRS